MIEVLAQAGGQGAATASESAPLGYVLLMILISSTFTDNILLTRFLGMCPFLSVSRQLRSAVEIGRASCRERV